MYVAMLCAGSDSIRHQWDLMMLHNYRNNYHLWKSTDFLEKVTYFRTGRTFCSSFSTTPVKKANTGNQQNTTEKIDFDK